MDLTEIIGYVFLAIFILTSLLTLASLPGWIKIPENYRSNLFKVLILEVIAAIIALFYAGNFKDENYIIQVDPETNWIAWNLKTAQVFHPNVKVKLDTAVIAQKKIGLSKENALSRLKEQKLSIKYNDDQYQIQKDSIQSFGHVPKNSLRNGGFFNNLKDITLSSKSRSIYTKDTLANASWRRNKAFKTSFPFEVKVEDIKYTGTVYKIIQSADDRSKEKVLYSSEENPNVIDGAENKPIHFFKHGINYYMIYLDVVNNGGFDSNRKKTKRYFEFIQLKLEPSIK